MSRNDKEKTTLYIDPLVKKSVKFYALRDDRSLSDIVHQQLIDCLEDQDDRAVYDKAKNSQ